MILGENDLEGELRLNKREVPIKQTNSVNFVTVQVTNKDKLFKAEIWAGEDEKSYEATEFNFHAPSEHTFNGW